MKKAYDSARSRELEAIASGNEQLISPEERESLKREKAAAEAAGQALETEEDVERNRQRAIASNHCPIQVQIGTTETCVHLLMGEPDKSNDDALSGKQLVYPHDAYVYIGLDGRVEDIQKSY